MRLTARLLLVVLFAACASARSPGSATPSTPPTLRRSTLPPAPKHIVIIVEENRTLAEIVGDKRLSTIHALAAAGTLFTNSHGVAHPSLPNYFALFAGKTNSDGDDCSDKPIDALGDLPVNAGMTARMPTLASELIAAHKTFTGFAESLPAQGYVGCFGRGGPFFGLYYKRHTPWAFFTKAGHPGEVKKDTSHYLLDDVLSQPFSAFPKPGRYDDLPTVAFVVPNVKNDMHGSALGDTEEGLEEDADLWLAHNMKPLVSWASDPKNATLIILTWDESDRHGGEPDTNQIPTIFAGSMVKQGDDAETITHYNVLATIEHFYGLAPLTKNDNVNPVSQCWKTQTQPSQ